MSDYFRVATRWVESSIHFVQILGYLDRIESMDVNVPRCIEFWSTGGPQFTRGNGWWLWWLDGDFYRELEVGQGIHWFIHHHFIESIHRSNIASAKTMKHKSNSIEVKHKRNINQYNPLKITTSKSPPKRVGSISFVFPYQGNIICSDVFFL